MVDYYERKIKDAVKEVIWKAMIKANPELKKSENPYAVGEFLDSEAKFVRELTDETLKRILNLQGAKTQ